MMVWVHQKGSILYTGARRNHDSSPTRHTPQLVPVCILMLVGVHLYSIVLLVSLVFVATWWSKDLNIYLEHHLYGIF